MTSIDVIVTSHISKIIASTLHIHIHSHATAASSAKKTATAKETTEQIFRMVQNWRRFSVISR